MQNFATVVKSQNPNRHRRYHATKSHAYIPILSQNHHDPDDQNPNSTILHRTRPQEESKTHLRNTTKHNDNHSNTLKIITHWNTHVQLPRENTTQKQHHHHTKHADPRSNNTNLYNSHTHTNRESPRTNSTKRIIIIIIIKENLLVFAVSITGRMASIRLWENKEHG